jgi:hypothetical protein
MVMDRLASLRRLKACGTKKRGGVMRKQVWFRRYIDLRSYFFSLACWFLHASQRPVQTGESQAMGLAGSAPAASPPPAFHTRTRKYLLVESVIVGVQLTA